MEIETETIYELLAVDDYDGLAALIDNILRKDIQSKDDWEKLVSILEVGCWEIYRKHWLKTHHIILSIFGIPELRGVDRTLFSELRSLDTPETIEEASNSLFNVLAEATREQFRIGGSTLFFDVTQISSTQSAILTADLIRARYRETIHVLNEIDELLPSLTKEWVNMERLWRTGNGFRMLRARNMGILIHIKEYKEIRNLLAGEMNVSSGKIAKESGRLRKEGESDYLQLSKTLDKFVEGLIASRGIRGTFEPHYKAWIDHEGLDEF